MSDINKDSGIPEQDQKLSNDNASNQNGNLYNGPEDGSTYWESNEIQSSFEAQTQQSENNGYDNNQKSQDLTYDEFKNNQYQLQQKKKSKKKPIIAALIVVVLLFAFAATAYAFNGTFRNSIDLLLKSPRDYYAYIENKSIGSAVDKSIAYNNMSNKNKDEVAVQLTANLSYDKDTVGAMLQSYTGMTISDFESVIGLSLNSIGFDILSANKDNVLYQNIGLNLNSIDIISGDVFIDYAAKEMLFHLPELSPAYLKQSLDTSEFGTEDFDYDGFSEAMKKLSSDSAGELVKRYAKLITDEIEDVKLTKNEKLTVGELTADTNLLTVSLYPETLKNITIGVLEEAKGDEFILEFLPLFEMTKEEFITEIDETIEEAKSSFDSLPQDDVVMLMKVYVGNDGSILGRTMELINVHQDTITMGFSSVEQNNKGAYEFYISENNEENIVNVSGSHSIENKAYTGTATFEVLSEDTGDIEFEIEYEDISYELKNNKPYLYGNINLSSYAMMGMEVALELDVKDDAQLATIKLNMGKSSLVTLETSTKYLEDFTIPKPDSNAQSFDALTETNEYAATLKLEEYISALSDRLGVDLNGLLGSFLPIY